MKNKLHFIVLILILILILMSFLIYSLNKSSKAKSTRDDFKWGVTFDPYPYGVVDEKVLDQGLARAKELGVKWLRFNILNYPNDPFTLTDTVYSNAVKDDFNVVLIFQPDKDFQEFSDPYKAGYDQAYLITSHYKDVKYFQLGNEPAAAAIKPLWPGVDYDSFDQEKYQKVLLWLKGATEGTKKANPKAKRVITGNWLNTGFFKMLNDDKLDYEIIGWDWHQKNPDLTKIENQDKFYNLIDVLSSLNKEIWITEAGFLDGSLNGEDPQADFMSKLLKQVYGSKKFSGFFTFVLFDGKPQYDGDNNNLGIIKNTTIDGKLSPGEPKKVYWVLKDYIFYAKNKTLY